MHKRTIVAFALFVAASCSWPLGPDTGDLRGRWSGTVLVTECAKTGGFTSFGPVPCPSTWTAGNSLPVAVSFTKADGAKLEGYAAYADRAHELFEVSPPEPLFQRFYTRLESDKSMQFDSVAQNPRFGQDDVSWTLKIVNSNRLDGTLRARTIVARTPGETIVTGTVVLTRSQ